MLQAFGQARVGRDVEMRYTASGTAVVNVSLAFPYGTKQNGEYPTQWVDATLWGKQAEALSAYLVKGQLLTVSMDDMHMEAFNKKDGSQGFKIVGRILSIAFAGQRENRESGSEAAVRELVKEQNARQRERQDGSGTSFDDMSDDIPF